MAMHDEYQEQLGWTSKLIKVQGRAACLIVKGLPCAALHNDGLSRGVYQAEHETCNEPRAARNVAQKGFADVLRRRLNGQRE